MSCCNPGGTCQKQIFGYTSWTAAISSGAGNVPQVSADQNLPNNSVKAQRHRVCCSHVSNTSRRWESYCDLFILNYKNKLFPLTSCAVLFEPCWETSQKQRLDLQCNHFLVVNLECVCWRPGSSASSRRSSLTSSKTWWIEPRLQQARKTPEAWACGRCTGRNFHLLSLNIRSFIDIHMGGEVKIFWKWGKSQNK